MTDQFGKQNSSLLIVYTHQKIDQKHWNGNFVIEITKENIILYDADYSVQATTWKPFSAVGPSRIVFLQKEPDEIISYKLSCLCSKKYMPYIEVSSNFGTLACNSRKKIRIHANDCIIHNAILKMIFEGTNKGQMTKSIQTSFPPPYALPITLENYMKGIGYTDAIAGIEYNKSEEKSFMERLILMLVPLILETTPSNYLKYDVDGVKILWESKKQRVALTRQYVEIFKQKVISNYTFKNCNNFD
ncbi:unnamed protein product [Cercopithifilaria johnstoni]|uniref:Uncharacterized protein n=1 Tax=Cercopithifilaria johnstoni TaxID=2874296 RepID=A0A8J2M0P1_9BILA|nr:unnamed protein product [Cercopithifilaria johnstoni]